MVLQRAPQQANLWGWTATPNQRVTVAFGGSALPTTSWDTGLWVLSLPPTAAGGPYNITVISGGQSVTLQNVLFGDVWICGGQSNMQFTVDSAFNASYEVAQAANYPNIRVMTVGQKNYSDTPLDDLAQVSYPWAVASPESIGVGNWSSFSAVCWFHAKNLYDFNQVPLGLVSSNWSGTPIQYWVSADAYNVCNGSQYKPKLTDELDQPLAAMTPSSLYNAMIYPLLRMRVVGALWDQAEQNYAQPEYYACQFPVMIDQWRKDWGYTPAEFGFYFVLLQAIPTNYAPIRQAQYAGLTRPYVGMGTMIDLGDLGSPWGAVHPRNKQEIGRRLFLASSAQLYGNKVIYLGPNATSVEMTQNKDNSATFQVSFDPASVGGGLKNVTATCPAGVQSYCAGFEILGTDNSWYPAQLSALLESNTATVTGALKPGVTAAGQVRYGWNGWPLCSLYNDAGLPATPFWLTA